MGRASCDRRWNRTIDRRGLCRNAIRKHHEYASARFRVCERSAARNLLARHVLETGDWPWSVRWLALRDACRGYSPRADAAGCRCGGNQRWLADGRPLDCASLLQRNGREFLDGDLGLDDMLRG